MFNEKFRSNPNLIEYAPKVLVYKNFINGELLEKINNLCANYAKLENLNAKKSVDHNISWYSNRFTPAYFEMLEVWEKASEFIYPELVIHPQASMLISRVGDEGMFDHSDAPGAPHENCGPVCGTCDIEGAKLISSDVWNTCCRLHYGLIVYFGEWEGGEIRYKNIDNTGKYIGESEPLNNGNELKIKPEAGDLVLHGAHDDYNHGTMPVTKGTRFAFSNFALPAHSNPGTFYNYKTQEYYNQIEKVKNSKRITDWLQPVNDYIWTDPELVLREKEQGISGVRYRDAIS